MKESFEEKVKKMMKELSLEESKYQPDIEKIWQNANRNSFPFKKKGNLFSVWTHAAAVFLGIFISGLTFYFLNQPKTPFLQKPESTPNSLIIYSPYSSLEKPFEEEKTIQIPPNKPRHPSKQKEIARNINSEKKSAQPELVKVQNPKNIVDKPNVSNLERSESKSELEVVFLSDYSKEFSNKTTKPSTGLWAVYEQKNNLKSKDSVKNSFVSYFLKSGNTF